MTSPLRLRRPAVLAALALLAACGGEPAGPGPRPASPPSPTPAPGLPALHGRSPCSDPGAGPEPDAAGLRAFVSRRSRQLRDCYQRALKRDASSGGKATFSFTIDSCGRLSGVEVASRRGRVDDAAACAARAIADWQTPFRPAEPVTVEYPIAFSSSM